MVAPDALESCWVLGKGQNLALKINGEFFLSTPAEAALYLLHPVSSTQVGASSLKLTTFSQNPISNWGIC